MYWILGLIGFVAGALIGSSADASMLYCGVLGAMMLLVLGAALRSRRSRTPGAAHAVASNTPVVEPLAVRVERLESQVHSLMAEIAALREPWLVPSSIERSPVQQAESPMVSVESAQMEAPRATEDATERETDPATVLPSATFAEQPPVAPQSSTATPAAAPSRESEAVAAEAAVNVTPVVSRSEQQPASRAPREPDWAERLFAAARGWLLGGNTVVRVGIIVLFFGVAFLLKYAADNSMLPVEFRLAGVALGATALLVTGWRVGNRRGAYGLVLQGGGVGVLYLTTFAATKLYALLPAGAAFPLMVTVCALSAFLAVRQDARSLAVMGSAGGFLAPVLLASGGGSHVALFGYYALLNAGIFAIAWFKAWRPLNVLGFVFTFVIGTAWGVTAYRPAFFSSTEPFLILFFLMYVGIGLLYAVRREIALRHYVDGTLVFGTPIVTVGLQAALVKGMPFGLAWSAVALAAFYLSIAGWLSRYRDRLGILFESMLAIAVLFATLAIPLAFTGPTTSAAWAVEGAAITWLGVRQRHPLQFGFGLVMQLAAACAFVVGQTAGSATAVSAAHLPILNGNYLATLLLAAAGVFTGWWLDARGEARNWHTWMPQVGAMAAAWGLLWWIGGGAREIEIYARTHVGTGAADWGPAKARFMLDAFALFAMFTAWLAFALRRRLGWTLAKWPVLAAVPALAGLVLYAVGLHEAPLIGLGRFAWPAALMAAYALLRCEERDVNARVLAGFHTAMFWSVSVLFALQAYWWLFARVPEGAWTWSAWAYVYGGLVLAVSTIGTRLAWPIGRYARAYQLWGAGPLVALLWGWSIASLASDGDASPLFWLPLLNPLDVAQLLVALAAYAWVRRARALGVGARLPEAIYALLATVFLWFNALILRTLHHGFHVAYDVSVVQSSVGLQEIFLALWCAFAFAGFGLLRRGELARRFIAAAAPLLGAMWIWTLYANLTQDGGTLARWPLVNGLDLAQVGVYAAAAVWLLRARQLGVRLDGYRAALQVVSGATAFLWLNTMLLRTIHHWTGVPYAIDALAQSTLVQASVSVFWTVCALAMTVWATRRRSRPLWFTGAALLGVTVVKLFMFDLSHVNGLARIVSFIGIGLMLLLIGYLSPLPPKTGVGAAAEEGVQ